MTSEQLDEIEKDAARRDEATAQILMLVKAVREARVELGEVLDELAFIREGYGDGDPAKMTADALLLKVKTITLDYNKARAEVERVAEKTRIAVKGDYESLYSAHQWAKAEVARLKAERDEARKWLEGICSEFEGTIAHAEWRAAGSKGMSVPFHGDFADVVQLPSTVNRMRWWVKVFRAALKGEQP